MTTRPQPASRLGRRLGTADATAVGVGSMVGTGVFVVFGPATAEAGTAVGLALLLAAAVAACNATSSARLAAAHPTSGGTYSSGRAELGPWWGFTAGAAFLVGKTSSCAAGALVVGTALLPGTPRLGALLAVVVAVGLGVRGVTRTVRATQVMVAVVLVVLLLVAAVVLLDGRAPTADGADRTRALDLLTPSVDGAGGVLGVLGAAGLLFFAFAGYARVATLAEEVRDPRRALPRAIGLAFVVVLVVYVLVLVVVAQALGLSTLAGSSTPVVDAATATGAAWLEPVVRVGVVLGAGGAFLALLPGLSRTAFAMASARDLPAALGRVDHRTGVPVRAELVVGAVVAASVLTGGLVGAVAVSATTVLLYYLVTNLAALRLDDGRGPARLAAYVGVVGCAVLSLSLPPAQVALGLGLVALALAARAVALHRRGAALRAS